MLDSNGANFVSTTQQILYLHDICELSADEIIHTISIDWEISEFDASVRVEYALSTINKEMK